MAVVFIFAALAAATIAFLAQWLLQPHRRTKIIFAAALFPTTFIVAALVVGGIFIDKDQNWLQSAVSAAFWFCTFTFIGLVAAIVGSELASLIKQRLRR